MPADIPAHITAIVAGAYDQQGRLIEPLVLSASDIAVLTAATMQDAQDITQAAFAQAIATATRLHAAAPHLVSAQAVVDLQERARRAPEPPAPDHPTNTPQPATRSEQTTWILTLVLIIVFVIWRILMQ